MEKIFLCPVCRGQLFQSGQSMRCCKGHCYDLSSAGYVNLLLGGTPGAVPGDNKEMCASRNRFLSKDYYRCLAQSISDYLVKALPMPSPMLLDAACGEGYYTNALCNALVAAGKKPLIAGVDISKFALKYAAKRSPSICFAAASIFDLPLANCVADAVTNIFAPVADREFYRVLKPGGKLVVVGPAEDHLWELKAFLYETPYRNELKHFSFDGFSFVKTLRPRDVLTLPCAEDIQNLFTMTPYFWKTPQEATRRLLTLTKLTTRISFEVHIFEKQTDNHLKNS